MIDDTNKLDALLHEHEIVNKKIDDFINQQFIYITTILTMAGSFIFFAIQNKIKSDEFYIYIEFLPYLFVIVGPTFMYKFNRAIILHGYRCNIEEQINKLLGKNFIVGAYLVKRKLLERNPFTILNYLVLLAFPSISIYFCHKYPEFTTDYNFWIQISLLIIGGGVFVHQNGKAFINGYLFSKELLNKNHNIVGFKNEEDSN